MNLVKIRKIKSKLKTNKKYKIVKKIPKTKQICLNRLGIWNEYIN